MPILDKRGLAERRIKVRWLRLALSVMIVSLFLLAEMALAEGVKNPQPKTGREGEIKILITADQVEFDSQNEIATYTGQVTVTQENTFLYADRVEVHFLDKGKDVDLIKAFGHIRVVQADRKSVV